MVFSLQFVQEAPPLAGGAGLSRRKAAEAGLRSLALRASLKKAAYVEKSALASRK
jgi:hypothetical protein